MAHSFIPRKRNKRCFWKTSRETLQWIPWRTYSHTGNVVFFLIWSVELNTGIMNFCIVINEMKKFCQYFTNNHSKHTVLLYYIAIICPSCQMYTFVIMSTLLSFLCCNYVCWHQYYFVSILLYGIWHCYQYVNIWCYVLEFFIPAM